MNTVRSILRKLYKYTRLKVIWKAEERAEFIPELDFPSLK